MENLHCLPEEFIYLVLLASWISPPERVLEGQIEFLEFFSGKARVSTLAAWAGLETRSVDILYDKPEPKISAHSGRQQRSAMDICGEAGFLLPGFTMIPIPTMNFCTEHDSLQQPLPQHLEKPTEAVYLALPSGAVF